MGVCVGGGVLGGNNRKYLCGRMGEWRKSGHSCHLLSRLTFFHAAQSASVILQERATHGLQAEPCVCVCV